MRARSIVLALLLLVLASSGCFVLEELDAGREELERRSFSERAREPAAEPEPEPEPRGGAASATASAARTVESWWKGARSLTPGEETGDLVRCRLGAEELYMRASECAGRRGTVVP